MRFSIFDSRAAPEPSCSPTSPDDFFRAHQDAPDSADQPCPPEIRRRKVSTILFLNEQSKKREPDEYGGGSLFFNGLLDKKGAQGAGIAVVPERGLLVAFRSRSGTTSTRFRLGLAIRW